MYVYIYIYEYSIHTCKHCMCMHILTVYIMILPRTYVDIPYTVCTLYVLTPTYSAYHDITTFFLNIILRAALFLCTCTVCIGVPIHVYNGTDSSL